MTIINFAQFKKFFIFSLIGSLIVSALVAVVAVLIGDFSEVTARVFFTLGMVVVHSLISLVFIWDDEKQNTFERLAFFINVLFSLIVVSFLTSIFGIWKIIPTETVFKLYQAYFVIGFAALHKDALSKVLGKEKYMDAIIRANYLFIGLVMVMLWPVIFVDDAFVVLGDMYFRILASVAIVDGTLSVLTMIFYKLYIRNHPLEVVKIQKKGLSGWMWVLIIYLMFQVFTSVAGMTFYRVSSFVR